ncbi:hypothetical protein [Archaeoglobus neptunius]|uniref:hypothetical protein n=1 Tax=Archaeoglobus neptunius TaxID=2798580 RepID=UPI001928A03F|nr:hypothetical protein [Archaeoglobus neptunius]
MKCETCRYFVKCLEWNCLRKWDCEFYEDLESLKQEELDEIDRNFSRIYEMDFDSFKKLVEDIGYFEQDAALMTGFKVWKKVLQLKNGGKSIK